MRILLALSTFAAAPLLTAQGLVSPATAASTEANYDNSLPLGFGGPQQSYLQIHADLAGRPGTFNRIALRRDGVYRTDPGMVAKTVTASLWFGQGVPIAGMSATFAANFAAGSKTQVATAKVFSLPDWTQKPGAPPAPFDVVLPLDAPYVWSGTGPFAWEMRVHDMSSTHPMFADAQRTTEFGTSSGNSYTSPCPMTGGSIFLSSSFSSSLRGGHVLRWSMATPRLGAPAVIWFGATQANVAVPGLCRSIAAEPTISIPGATRSGDGGYEIAPWLTTYTPAFAGVHVFAQGAVLDAGRADPIGVALSAGLDTIVPAAPVPLVARLYHASDDTATSGFLDPNGTWLGSVIRLD
jgi:hypothetical protein